jgi:hypothetical protein
MDAPERGALMLVRFSAAALMAVSVVELALYWLESNVHHTPLQAAHGVLLSIPFVLGVIALIKAKTIAEWISDKFDL